MFSRFALRRLSYKSTSVSPPPPTREDIVTAFDNYDIYAKIRADRRIPRGFQFPTAISLLPMVVGAGCTAICPHFSVLLPVLPKIAQLTVTYVALHCCLYSGVHWGLAAATYNPSETGEDRRNRMQFLTGALGHCAMMGSLLLFSPEYCLHSLALISSTYLSTLFADIVYTDSYKLLPVWYSRYKKFVTMVAVGTIAVLAYGFVRFPKETRPAGREVKVQTLAELARVS